MIPLLPCKTRQTVNTVTEFQTMKDGMPMCAVGCWKCGQLVEADGLRAVVRAWNKQNTNELPNV